jgi:hypothetical protein
MLASLDQWCARVRELRRTTLALFVALLAPIGCSAGAGAVGPDGSASDAAPHDTASAANGAAPGRYLTNVGTVGTGACAGLTLSSVIEKIQALDPSLADIGTIYAPAGGTGDGSFIYPYGRGDGGFDVVFKRGLGDCPAGCTENDYRYFSTDQACRPQKVGQYHAAWGADSCLEVEGTPMWNHPPAPDPVTVCGQNSAAAVLDGTYRLHAVGQRLPCSTAGGKASAVNATVTVTVAQDAQDPSTGFVTFSGTGHALIDGVPLPSRFQRQRFDAALKATNLPNACPRESSVTARFDFEGYQSGGIELGEQGNDACELCKGSMSLVLTL